MDRDGSRGDIKAENSIPAQSRISVISLSVLDAYWKDSGYRIRTMSQLISFSIELLCEILKANKKISNQTPSITEALQYLESRGLHQQSLHKRGLKKLGVAIAFEGMREEGIRPESYAPRIYSKLHNERSVQPFTGRIDNEQVRQATEIMNNLPETNHSLLDELGGRPSKNNNPSDEVILKEGTSPEELAQRIAADDKANMEALNSFDPMSLISTAKKD